MTSGLTCEPLAEPQQQQLQVSASSSAVLDLEQQQQLAQLQQLDDNDQQEDQPILVGGRQYRSESSDSGQLSLISSFGSISINQIVNQPSGHARYQQRLPSESSQDFPGYNYVDYHQYCSLLLLNTFDCCEEDIIKGTQDGHLISLQQRQQQSQLNNSPINLQNSNSNYNYNYIESLSERRARWFADLEQHLQASAKGAAAEEETKVKLVEVCEPAEIAVKKAAPSKEFCASPAADVKSKPTNGNGKRAKGKAKKSSKRLVATLAATQASLMDKIWTHVVKRAVVPASAGGASPNAAQAQQQQQQQHEPPKEAQQAAAAATTTTKTNGVGGGGLHILSDLSRRFVRRCVAGSSAKAAAKTSDDNALEKKRAADTATAASLVEGGDQRASVQLPPPTPPASSDSCQQLSGPNNLNASISTLNTTTTPSGCCHCDNETCSSSGFVSSSGLVSSSAATSSSAGGGLGAAVAAAVSASMPGHATCRASSPGSTIATLASTNCCNESCNSSTCQDQHMTMSAPLASSSPMAQAQPPAGELTLNQSPIVDCGSSNSAKYQAQTGAMAAVSPAADQYSNHSGTEAFKATSKSGKGSLISRARNSTINLASLAPITSRFHCSASVGNLWQQHHQPGAQQSPCAANIGELQTPERESIRALDYATNRTFDETARTVDAPTTGNGNNNNKSFTSGTKLGSAQSCAGSSRKLSTKEKSRRQKDTERVEKLRLLVSYLRSGSSQPVVSPVALEADEIELAERYKLHMTLRNDELFDLTHPAMPTTSHRSSPMIAGSGGSCNTGANSNCDRTMHKHHIDRHQQHQQRQSHDQPCSASSKAATSNTSLTTSSCSVQDQRRRGSLGMLGLGARGDIKKQQGGFGVRTTPGRAGATTRSIPHIGQVSWVLRHSVSDPGNKFAQGSIVSCTPTSGARSSTASAFSAAAATAFDAGKMPAPSSNQVGQQQLNSAPTRSPLPNQANHDSSNSSAINRQQPVRLFYIDDLDAPQAQPKQKQPVTPLSPTEAAPAANRSATQQQPLDATTNPITTSTANYSTADMMTQAISNGSFTSASTSSTSSHPAASTVSATMSSSKSCSAWTNPQNLATWIDNEVNSIVHDLEVNESRQKHSNASQKHNNSQQQQQQPGGKMSPSSSSSNNSSCKNKEGKRKWLSVAGSTIRRNSSGAQST